jgi:hypothetical protein
LHQRQEEGKNETIINKVSEKTRHHLIP